MKSTTRYALIIFGFFVFVILAPLLILYVSGTTFNFDGNGSNSTGIFDAKSNPSGAKVLINGKEHSSAPAIARFLDQGEYVFTITKDGYYDWSKRLPIESGQVSYAQVGVDEVQLIKKSEPVNIAGPDISSFIMIDDKLWYTTGSKLSYLALGNQSPSTIEAVSSGYIDKRLRDKKHFIYTIDRGTPDPDDSSSNLFQDALINSSNNRVDLLPISLRNEKSIEMASDNIVLVLSENKITAYNLNTKTISEVKKDVLEFTTLGDTGYFLNSDGTITNAVWNGTNYFNEQIIVDQTPDPVADDFNDLIITDNKELFLHKQLTGLFRVGNSLEKVVDNLSYLYFDMSTNEISYTKANELDFYNFITHRSQLLTRSTELYEPYFVRSNIGYGFAISDKGLELIEIDGRDHQNRYVLLEGRTVSNFAIAANQKTIIALVDGSLVMLEIRN